MYMCMYNEHPYGQLYIYVWVFSLHHIRCEIYFWLLLHELCGRDFVFNIEMVWQCTVLIRIYGCIKNLRQWKGCFMVFLWDFTFWLLLCGRTSRGVGLGILYFDFFSVLLDVLIAVVLAVSFVTRRQAILQLQVPIHVFSI